MATTYLRGKTWWISYSVGRKRIQRSLKTTNAREAEEYRKQYSAAETINLLPEPSSTPIGPFLQDLCEYWRKTRKGKGAASDIGRLRQFFGPACEAMEYPPRTEKRFKDNPPKTPKRRSDDGDCFIPIKKLEQLTPKMIDAILRERYLAGEITGKTANRYRGVLSSMFTYARKHHGYICPDRRYRSPIEGVDRFPEQTPPIRWLNHQQIDEQLKVLEPYPQLRAMVAVAIFAGPRREAVTWLTREDVDLDNRVLHIRAKEIDGQYWEPKTGRDRSVPISNRLAEILGDYQPPAESTWFFPSPQGERYHPDNFSAKLHDVNEAAGLKWSCMDFRHTFGSHLAQKGVSLYKISALMGNSPEIARRHYAALLPAEMREEVEFATPGKDGDGNPEPDPTTAVLQQLLAKIDRLDRQADLRNRPPLRIAK